LGKTTKGVALAVGKRGRALEEKEIFKCHELP